MSLFIQIHIEFLSIVNVLFLIFKESLFVVSKESRYTSFNVTKTSCNFDGIIPLKLYDTKPN